MEKPAEQDKMAPFQQTATTKMTSRYSHAGFGRCSLLPLGVALTIVKICLHGPFSTFTEAFVAVPDYSSLSISSFSTRLPKHYPVTEWRIRRRLLQEDGDMMRLSAQKENNLDRNNKKKKRADSPNLKKPGGGQLRSRLLIRANGNGGVGIVHQSKLLSPPSPVVPDLTHYAVNRNNQATNQARLFHDKIACPHFGQCSGCVVDIQMANIPIVESARRFFSSTALRRQRVDNTANNANEDDDFFKLVVPSKVTTWRTQAKLAVAPRSTSAWATNNANAASGRSGCVFGLYQRGSHQVLPIPDCMVHHPSINQAIAALEMATAKVGTQAAAAAATTISSSSSSKGQRRSMNDAANNNYMNGDGGGLRYVQCQVERTTGKVSLTLVWHAEQFKETQPALPRLVKELQRIQPNLWHSIWCHCNNGYGNNIFHRSGGSGSSSSSRHDRNKKSVTTSTARTKGRQRWYRLMGPEYLREPIPRVVNDYNTAKQHDGGWLYYTPYTFRQGNSMGFDIIACDVAQAIPPGSKVCELYAGVGVLSLTALAHHHHDDNDSGSALQWIRCSDENPANPRCFALAVASLPDSVTTTTKRQGPAPETARNKRKRVDKKEMTLADYAEMIDSGQMPYHDNNNNNDDNEKTRYLVASATQALHAGEALGANVLIVDPPRKGLEEGVLEELCKPINRQQPYVESSTSLLVDDDENEKSSINWTNDVRTLIYVSCGFDALASDTEKLLFSSSGGGSRGSGGGGGGGWRLKSATGYILFPGSNHVETLCIFERR